MDSFGASDAWVLQSIHQAGEDATLRDIVAVGDHLNHAVITYDELAGGYLRLSAAGVVTFSSGIFKTTPFFSSWWSRKFGKKKSVSVSKEYQEMLEWLSTLPAPSLRSEVIPFERSVFEKVVKEYCG